MNLTNNSIFSKTFWITLLIKQNKHHRYGVLAHTLKVLMGTIKNRDWKFIIPALLHDIGKPIVAYQKQEDVLNHEYSFTDHEEKSYQIIKNWPFITDRVKNIVRYHYIIRNIKKSKTKNDFERLARLEKSWENFDNKFISELYVFLKYDDYGKS
jgi:predicted HD phosphohydrolase